MTDTTDGSYVPRRSVLYMPGANERALEKAKGLDADALILDLEDAVAPDAKAEARDRVCAAASSGEYGAKEVAIRVNGLTTQWHADDIAAAAAAGPAAVVVPKVDSVADVHAIEKGLEAGGATSILDIPVRVTPNGLGMRAFEVKVYSNDPDEPVTAPEADEQEPTS